MIAVTQLNGKKVALNVDRIERVEHNDANDDTNIYLFGGAYFIVTESVEEVIEAIVDAKSHVLARALSFVGTPAVETAADHASSTGSPSPLHVVPLKGDPE